jgi:hypothetical protein
VAGIYMSLVLDSVRDLTRGELLTLIAFADRAPFGKKTAPTDVGRAWPSLADIAERTRASERQVRNDVRVIERREWMRAEGSKIGGRKLTSRYRLNVEKMLPLVDPKKLASYLLEFRAKPGSLLPGFVLFSGPANPEVHDQKPGSTRPETRKCTSAEQVLTERNSNASASKQRPERTASERRGHKDGLNGNGSGSWRRDPDAAARKAEQLGLKTRPGESLEELVVRIDQTIAERARMERR